MTKTSLTFFCFIFARLLFAQDSTVLSNIEWSGYLETYYAYDFAEPAGHDRPDFFYNYHRHNEVNLNLGFVKGSFRSARVRSNLALMAGTYAAANLRQEPVMLRNVFEANGGVKLSSKLSLWLDAGIFPSHIGFESAIGQDCWNLTRSILADNSPYYEAGIKLSYTNPSEKFYFSGLLLNGWQTITKTFGIQSPAFGTQLTLKPSKKFVFNWSTFAGRMRPSSMYSWRYFNNLYAQAQLNEKFGLIAGIDHGIEQSPSNSAIYNQWMAPVVIAQYKAGRKIRLALRAEYYTDPNEVVIQQGRANGFNVMGGSFNFDYWLLDNCLLRCEYRTLQADQDIFRKSLGFSANNSFVTGSFSVRF